MILVVNEIARASEFAQTTSERMVYAPFVYSDVQNAFLTARYNALRSKFSHSDFAPNRATDFAAAAKVVFAWDAEDELRLYGPKLAKTSQNRLFSHLDISIPNGFSGFRKKVEALLPNRFENTMAPSDIEVQQKMQSYFLNSDAPSSYFDTRNQLVGDRFSSALSPFLACGVLDVRYLYNCIKDYEEVHGSNKSTYWLVFELLWREFFYWLYQKHGKAFFSQGGVNKAKSFAPIQSLSISELRDVSAAPFWQAALNEIEQTGYPSNRVRQLFASQWIHEYKLNWRSGADFYEKHLIDYDVYSNWGNWMYVCGLAGSSRPRVFNIEEQLQRYDPENAYCKKWL